MALQEIRLLSAKGNSRGVVLSMTAEQAVALATALLVQASQFHEVTVSIGDAPALLNDHVNGVAASIGNASR